MKAILRSMVVFCAIAAASAVLSGCTVDDAPGSPDVRSSAGDAGGVPKTTEEPITATVEPVIVVASVDVDGEHVSASGYVAGVVEDGGACTFTFTAVDGAEAVVAEAVGVADRATTSCGMVSEAASSFTRGTWEVRLEYVALNGAVSQSEAARLEVP